MSAKLAGKVVLVTGGASGIGAAICELFVQAGARVVVADWNADGVAEVARRLGEPASPCQADVSQSADTQAMVARAVQTFGRLDVLVNNAGWGGVPAPLHEVREQDWDKTLAICLKGVFLGMKAALPVMVAQKSGAIINMASVAGVIAAPGLAAYGAAKAGVIELTKVVAVEYARYGIRCNALAPAWTHTPMVEQYLRFGGEGAQERMLKSIPQRRFAEAGEIAQAALFLASDDSPFVHGHTLVLDGGLTIL
jgi:NAD(P)-dependent dehydrogenase (short-subunit alcohol dehydrogenase family)